MEKSMRLPGMEGIPQYGICPFEPLRERLRSCWAAARLPQSARSVIVCLFPYFTHGKGNLSRYAAVPDYHQVAGGLLEQAAAELKQAFPGKQFVAFTDNSPIPEVYAACVAGLGVLGRHGLLITPVFGSYVFIGEIVTDQAFPAEAHPLRECPGCGACERACPTGAAGISGDKGACLSAVTQKKGDLSPAEAQMIRESGCIWGCDLCQEACPLNRDTPQTSLPGFLSDIRKSFNPGDPLEGRAFGWRGRAVIERNARLLKPDMAGKTGKSS